MDYKGQEASCRRLFHDDYHFSLLFSNFSLKLEYVHTSSHQKLIPHLIHFHFDRGLKESTKNQVPHKKRFL